MQAGRRSGTHQERVRTADKGRGAACECLNVEKDVKDNVDLLAASFDKKREEILDLPVIGDIV